MKEHANAVLRSFAAALCDAALSTLIIALMLALYDIPRTYTPASSRWALWLLVQAIVSEILVSRGSTLLIYAAAHAALIFAGVRLVVPATAFIPGSMGFPILLSWMVAASGLHSACAAQKLPDSNLFVRYADVLIASIAAYLATAFALGRSVNHPVLAFALLTLALCITTTSSLRAGGESDSVIRGTGVGGWLVLGALLALCLLLTAFLISLSSGHVDSLVSFLMFLWGCFTALCGKIAGVIAVIIRFLLGKPRAYRMEYVATEESIPVLEAVEMAESPDWMVYLFIALIAFLLLLGLFFLLRALHGTRLQRMSRMKQRRRVTRKSHFFCALRALLLRMAERIAFELAWRTHRRTPQGLYILARRTGRLHRLPQHISETAGAYLRRYHAALTQQGLSSTLDILAGMLDTALYGEKDIRLSSAEHEIWSAQISALHAPQRRPSEKA